MPHSVVKEREIQPVVLEKTEARAQTSVLTLTFAPDVDITPRVSGDHITTFQEGDTQHILWFLVFLQCGKRGGKASVSLDMSG